MTHYYWNDWYAAWGWFLWFGLLFLLFASLGNWGYAHRAHRRLSGRERDQMLDEETRSCALNILDERFASGAISYEEYERLRSAILDRKDHEPLENSTRKSA